MVFLWTHYINDTLLVLALVPALSFISRTTTTIDSTIIITIHNTSTGINVATTIITVLLLHVVLLTSLRCPYIHVLVT